MNIRRKTGKMVCIQKKGHRTLCGQNFTTRYFDAMCGLWCSEPNYIETDEPCTCQKCLELSVDKFLDRKSNMPDIDIDK